MKQIYKLVITGGPCAGKTTGLGKIKEEMEKEGYKVILIPETATILISSGGDLPSFGSRLNFQRNIFAMQRLLEDFYSTQVANTLPQEKVIVVFDRSLIDNRAFLTQEDYNIILKENNLSFDDVLNRYDAIFHLHTTAKGFAEFYTLENNKARTEGVDEAIAQDDRLIECYKGHDYFRMIESKINFNDKLNHLIDEIKIFLNRNND